jgi:hypothetical protein
MKHVFARRQNPDLITLFKATQTWTTIIRHTLTLTQNLSISPIITTNIINVSIPHHHSTISAPHHRRQQNTLNHRCISLFRHNICAFSASSSLLHMDPPACTTTSTSKQGSEEEDIEETIKSDILSW